MTDGTSQGLFVVVAIVIFGIFVALSYTVLGSDGLSGGMVNLFEGSVIDKSYFHMGTTDERHFDITEDGTIINYTGNKEGISDINIPRNIRGIRVTRVSAGAFYDKGLTSVILPNTLEIIEDGVSFNSDTGYYGAFERNQIVSLHIPDSVTYIGSGAFRRNHLEEVILPKGLERVSVASFQSNRLEKIQIPNTVISIRESSFRGNLLSDLTLPESVVIIYSDAFKNNQITSINFHENIRTIGSRAFQRNSLETLDLPIGVSYNTSSSNSTFDTGVIINIF